MRVAYLVLSLLALQCFAQQNSTGVITVPFDSNNVANIDAPISNPNSTLSSLAFYYDIALTAYNSARISNVSVYTTNSRRNFLVYYYIGHNLTNEIEIYEYIDPCSMRITNLDNTATLMTDGVTDAQSGTFSYTFIASNVKVYDVGNAQLALSCLFGEYSCPYDAQLAINATEYPNGYNLSISFATVYRSARIVLATFAADGNCPTDTVEGDPYYIVVEPTDDLQKVTINVAKNISVWWMRFMLEPGIEQTSYYSFNVTLNELPVNVEEVSDDDDFSLTDDWLLITLCVINVVLLIMLGLMIVLFVIALKQYRQSYRSLA